MNKPLSKDIIQEIADYMTVNPAFVEKDYYATKMLKELSEFKCLDYTVVFSGGTSLSKGFGLIKRFSEDLDFNIYNSSQITEGQRRTIRHAFREAIEEIKELKIEEVQTANGGKKETIFVSYPQTFATPNHLREHLQVELFFDPENNLDIEEREVISFIDSVIDNKNTVKISCNAPFNIMADKFNALVWRIYKEDASIDYTLMRHLHDLCALNKIIPINEKLKMRILSNYETKDKPRVKSDISFNDIISITREKLSTSKSYKDGYVKFVNSMSYAKDDEQINFDDALKIFNEISQLFI